jgi:hypothetical protein
MVAAFAGCLAAEASHAKAAIRVGSFAVEVTPPVGSALCLGLAPRMIGSSDPLTARGLVLKPANESAIVLVALDWLGVANESHDAWRQAIAGACDTTVDRVAVHTLHQHDAPGCDLATAAIVQEVDLADELMNVEFSRAAMTRVASAAATALDDAEVATHFGHGVGEVRKVASNRRILGPDGKVQYQRMSRSGDAMLRALPEGTIDPLVRCLSFWREDQPLIVLTYYATHPQSYYCTGKTSADFIGLARNARESALSGLRHIHFNGAGGNVAAGKYNDGSHRMRAELAGRVAAGMKAAWEATEKAPLEQASVEWNTIDVALPLADWLDKTELTVTLQNEDAPTTDRLQAARALAFLTRSDAGRQITIGRLRIGRVDVLHMPGELFVEYQLAAQRMSPKRLVCMAAYGDFGPGYIGMAASYSEGGYETGQPSRVSPRAEQVLMTAIATLLSEPPRDP